MLLFALATAILARKATEFVVKCLGRRKRSSFTMIVQPVFTCLPSKSYCVYLFQTVLICTKVISNNEIHVFFTKELRKSLISVEKNVYVSIRLLHRLHVVTVVIFYLTKFYYIKYGG